MDQLTQLVAQKTGISEQQAQTAVSTVMGFIREKLPAPVAAQVEAALGNPATLGQAASMLGGLGDMFGGSKE